MPTLSLSALENTLKHADPQTRHRTLRAVADLFLEEGIDFSESKLDIFDQLFESLIEGSVHSERVELSHRMAPAENAPRKLIRRLAEDPQISVAGPVLSQSPRLSTNDLCEIASSKSNLHLLAISQRSEISEPVTDILLERGDHAVAKTVVANTGAKFTKDGIGKIIDQADQTLIDSLRNRGDVLAHALRDVNARLLKGPERQRRTVELIGERVTSLLAGKPVGELQVRNFALENDYESVIACLSVLSNLNCGVVENIMQPHRVSGIVLVCKAIGLTWGTVDAILNLASVRNGVTENEVEKAHRDFVNMTKATAERIIRFWQIRKSVSA